MKRVVTFTLMELLVVIAVITVLFALLMPGLKAAREKGLQVACVNNLKQIGHGLGFYANDYGNRLPPCGYYWNYLSTGSYAWAYPADMRAGSAYVNLGAVYADMKCDRLFYCPKYPMRSASGYNYPYRTGYFYRQEQGYRRPFDGFQSGKAIAFEWELCTFARADAEPRIVHASLPFLCADGHVKSLPRADVVRTVGAVGETASVRASSSNALIWDGM